MKLIPFLLLGAVCGATALAQDATLKIERDVAYVEAGDPLQKLDVYAPPGARNLPVVVWIHGGGWQAGDKAEMKEKPAALAKKGFVFVSVNYRLEPKVTMGELVRDVAKSVGWVHAHIGEYGGDPQRLFIMGHSAGAQLAALLCTDERYFQEVGFSLNIVKRCVPVDGDTYDVPAMIVSEQNLRRAHGFPEPKFGHPEEFGTLEQQKDFSAVNHVAKGKGIPPFLILHVAANPMTTMQALELGRVLKGAGIDEKVFGAKDTSHGKLNDDLGVEGDPATKELSEFLERCLKS
jgi:acetyl esterase/lipase